MPNIANYLIIRHLFCNYFRRTHVKLNNQYSSSLKFKANTGYQRLTMFGMIIVLLIVSLYLHLFDFCVIDDTEIEYKDTFFL